MTTRTTHHHTQEFTMHIFDTPQCDPLHGTHTDPHTCGLRDADEQPTATVAGKTWTMDEDDIGGTSRTVTAWDDSGENTVLARSLFEVPEWDNDLNPSNAAAQRIFEAWDR